MGKAGGGVTEEIDATRQKYSTVLDMLIAQCHGSHMGVRVAYVGHGHHLVATCIHKTTLENLSACLAAISTLEGYPTEEGILAAIARCPEDIKVETYTAK